MADTAQVDDRPEAPRTPHEEAMVALWSEVLDRPDIAVSDDFFDLDGDSLHAIQLITRIREMYGVTVRAIDFFESPTVETLAAFVAAQEPNARAVIGVRPPDAEPVLSFDQHRLWLADQLAPGAAYNVHGRRRLLGPLRVDVLEASVRAIMVRHEALRTRFPDIDGEPLQVVDDLPADWRLRVADVSGDHADPADAVAAAVKLLDQDAMTVMDLAHGPLFLCLLVKVGDGDHVIGVTAHHTVCDNGSVSLFINELSALYRAEGDPTRADLPELPVQYRDFAVWQREWLGGDAVERELDYWSEHLAGAPPELTPPADARPAEVPAIAGGMVRTTLTEADTTLLHELGRAHDATLFMTLFTAYSVVLGRWCGQRDVVLGVPMTSRTDKAIEHLIGLFFNTLPIRLDMSRGPTFAELLARTREASLGAYAHTDVPLDLIVRRVRPPRFADRTPLFQAMLNVVVYAGGTTSLGDVEDERMDLPVVPSKLELLLSAQEVDGRLLLGLEYDAVRYDRACVQALVDDLVELIRAAHADSGMAVFAATEGAA
jgi:acyl carrier protein